MRDLGTALLIEIDSIEKQLHLLLNQATAHPNSIDFVSTSTKSIESSLSTILSLIRMLYSQSSQIDKNFNETTIRGDSIVNTLVLNSLSRLLLNLVLLNNKNLDILIPLMNRIFNKDTSITEDIKVTLEEVNKIEIK